MTRIGHGVAVICLIAAACGDGDGGGGGGGFEDDLDPAVVTDLPPGNGAGTSASGQYVRELVVTSCAGDCEIGGDEDGDAFSICDVGLEFTEFAQVEQSDGILDFDVDNNEYISRLAGGINSDGSFEIGGYITQGGGAIEATAREVGTISAWRLTGAGRRQIRSPSMDCVMGVDFDGMRQTDAD